MHTNPANMSLMDISKFNQEMKQKREYHDYCIETENYVLMKKELYKELSERKEIKHAHAVINWLGDAKCSNCDSHIDITEPYCQHCGARLDMSEERTE